MAVRYDRLTRVRALATQRLDRLDGLVPVQETEMPFAEYLARASLRAQSDPQFARALRRSLLLYRTAQGGIHGQNNV